MHYDFEIDVNSENPIVKEEDYGNLLLIDFEEKSPLLVHRKIDPSKLHLLSEKAQKLVQLLLIYSNYSVPIATIGCDAKNISNEIFEQKLNNLWKNIVDMNYNWLFLISTLEKESIGRNDKILMLQKWVLDYSKLYFDTTEFMHYDGVFLTQKLRENSKIDFEKIAIELPMAFRDKDKSLVEQVCNKHDFKYRQLIRITLYSMLLKYQLEEAVRIQNNVKKYTPQDWKKIFDIVFETASNLIKLKKYFPEVKDSSISLTYNQHYKDIRSNFYEGRVYLELSINQMLLAKYYFVMSKPK